MFGALNYIRIADIFSALNALFGILGIYFVFTDVRASALFLVASAIMDGVDGAVARLETSLLGENLDSLADMISFGVLPALIIISLGDEWYYFSISGLFLICGMIRLARFNLLKIKDEFVGFPITASALIVGAMVLIDFNAVAIAFVSVLLSLLMISDIRYPKVRDKIVLGVVAVVMVSVFFIPESAYILLALMVLYLFSPVLRRGYGEGCGK
ncbi:CDP-diacylglycerol--serine O-phosphatidyltransferase [Archaeoglobus sulfaticallidus PM70-1]|uniref:CDP-diacylglycerol--serine O-phosphatidyltransferase n=1 Tax=Archaeoglobus sulfaticallidus PM70-1 TaxID=387631 RepID=N0BEC1_9EURY|nr:CDP-diacylglycerol--serine O-phosphatidyltransferase [Archaeoglobus sulfaticallidus]AGK61964.1 CDP-diacylglycerol--serine O-phosphatidyltransferase [Archaeoglobus sulfaticallidus PM70-1]